MTYLNNSSHTKALVQIVESSNWFMPALEAVRSMRLESWCIGAGAVRNLVWDYLHGYEEPSPLTDIDVAYFDSMSLHIEQDAQIQARLLAMAPNLHWDVCNQALVHTWFESYFGHPVPPLHSLDEAVASWPEYATSVGVFLTAAGDIKVIAPHGLEDLFALRVQRNPARASIETYRQRVQQKQYTARWPRVLVVPC